MSEKTKGVSLNGVKDAEREWHEALYVSLADSAFPETTEQFRHVFTNNQLIPFCDGGWSWWSDARQQTLDLLGDVRSLRVLDYGCGYGALGMYLALNGAHVRGFDLSPTAIETANKAAQRYGLPASFEQMDAEKLAYASGSFDAVIGFGVLHHVIKYPRAGAELLRVLKPHGKALFHETLWDNPVINLARRFTTEPSEAGDAHLTERAIRQFGAGFSQVRLEKLHLLYMTKRLAKLPRAEWYVPLRPRPFWRALKAFDNQLLRIRPLQRYCGEVIVHLVK